MAEAFGTTPMLAFRTLAVAVALSSLATVAGRSASAFEERITALYRPMQAEQMALSPDGEYLAYTRNESGELAIYIMAVGRTDRKFRISVEDDRAVAFSKERAPARLRFLRWASAQQLVFAPTEQNNGVRMVAPIYAVNRDGTDPKTLAEADDFMLLGGEPEQLPIRLERHTNILGFVAGNRGALLVEALGKPTFPPATPIPTTLFSIDLATGKMKDLTEEYDDGRFFYDQKGAARLIYSHPRLSHTRNFRYYTGGTWGRWANANEATLGPIARAFPVTVENYYDERAFPLGFDVNPNILYYASNVGRDTYGVYALDLTTKQRTGVALEDPHVDLVSLEPGEANSALVFDESSGRLAGVRAVGLTPFTRWLDPELTGIQAEVDRKFPQRTVEILQWDDARVRFLLRVTGGVEPGRTFVYLRKENVLVEMLRRAPWLKNADLHASTTFAFDSPGGVHLTGHLTFPRKSRLNPPPLLIDFSDGLMGRPLPGFDPDAQALAEMGFIVARLNHRGGEGFGVKHRSAIHAGIDRVPVDDALAAIAWIAQHHAIDSRRIAVVGRGLGGYLALRALQLEPEAFRCAVAIEAPLDPRAWLEPPLEDLGPGASESPVDTGPGVMIMRRGPPPPINFLKEAQLAFLARGHQQPAALSVLRNAERLTKPVMLVVDPPRDDTITAQNSDLRSKLKRLGRPAEYVEVGSGFAENVPGAKAALFRQIEEFFNLNLYDYKVKVGPTKEVK
jgi:dipeptidyl aminopeptidase/acylaminoacyl peptidase